MGMESRVTAVATTKLRQNAVHTCELGENTYDHARKLHSVGRTAGNSQRCANDQINSGTNGSSTPITRPMAMTVYIETAGQLNFVSENGRGSPVVGIDSCELSDCSLVICPWSILAQIAARKLHVDKHQYTDNDRNNHAHCHRFGAGIEVHIRIIAIRQHWQRGGIALS